ncbi:hypothetical protein AZI85_15040 [Bdellovibrio bacteriovorus]|uniref:Uncharacterized protein n=1 Tax=Bdellovibrio bacteriovorus TaxID=959 RepID=A0A150WUH9_BDEBC|nr:hypothetical protein [Bdellovibrio bacteriovorus]KYG70168.1 hypothetical protein AZI85_15040 [Bdellovibrio bacteriovorus]
MIKELWSSFPRLLEQRINALLDEAEPNAMKAFQLYKTCQRENLWTDTFEKFSKQLESFFSIPKNERKKSSLDALLERPADVLVWEDFHLNFRTGLVDSRAVSNIVSWAHHLMRVSLKSNSSVISEDVLQRTMNYITNPPLYEKAKDITFEDFCAAWKKVVFQLFGKKHDDDLNHILKELHWLNTQLKYVEENKEPGGRFHPTIYLTQTEIDWVTEVHKSVVANTPLPKFPLSRGPQKQRLADLERAIQLYRIVQTTKLPELLEHRENIRVTILDRCTGLLRECAR